MAPVTHEIDPDADTIIILKNASIVFAPWNESMDVQGQARVSTILEAASDYRREISTFQKKKKMMLARKKKMANRAVVSPTSHTDTLNSVENLTAAIGIEPCSPMGASAESSDALSSSTPGIKLGTLEVEDIHFRVSSRHLILASPWFKRAMKKEGWSESGRSSEDGLFHVTAEDWDAEAFLILLHIFHLRNRQVPRTVSLEMLAKIGVLVDYYECGETIELFTAMWIDSVKSSNSVPSAYCRDLILWIWTSWVFDIDNYFEQSTAVAIKRSNETFHILHLPIPANIARKVEFKRYQAVESVISQLYDLLDKYCNRSYLCPTEPNASFECGCFLTGTLTKELDDMGLRSPRPEIPFPKLSFDALCDMVKATKSPQWAKFSLWDTHLHPCNLNLIVTEIVDKAIAGVSGLSLLGLKMGRKVPVKG